MKLGWLLLIVFFLPVAAMQIVRYEPERDEAELLQLLRENPLYLYHPSFTPENIVKGYCENKDTVYVVRDHNQLRGFVEFHIKWKRRWCGFLIQHSGNIRMLAVTERFRRQGYGTQLMNHAVAVMAHRKVNHPTIKVCKNNDSALNLYQRLGFRVESEIIVDEEHIYTMKK